MFRNRRDAGARLATHLSQWAGRSDVLVLALPRGGVPVAAEVASRLGVPFDVFLVRKIGAPGREEYAIGAIAEDGVEVIDRALVSRLGIPAALVQRTVMRERLELDRRDRLYRGARQPPPARDRTVILVDDGLATGASMEAAVRALRLRHPARVVVAAPVGAPETCRRLARVADEVVCVEQPEPFNAVGLWYEDFAQTSDEEVRALLAEGGLHAASRPGEPPADPAAVIRARAVPLGGAVRDYDVLVEGIGAASVVLIGEASHGTHEFYRERIRITRRLIEEQGFTAVAVEADWPDAYRVNRYVRGAGTDRDGIEALGDFRRFPAWMWRNADVLDFIGWLRTHNESKPADQQVGFYGLDLYSLHASMAAVISYLARIDPEAARRARDRYACFDRFGPEPQTYGYATDAGLAPSCEREVIDQLVELHRRRLEYARRDGRVARDDYFFAEQNARLVTSAEAYYRTMVRGRHESWNLRDRHMAETLVELRRFLASAGGGSRTVVWAHNSHLGDARATEMGQAGELNVGQLVRERLGADAVLVGFTTDHGTVTAAHEWDGPALRRHVRPAHPDSYERLFHQAGIARFLMPLRTDLELAAVVTAPHLERAIGVIYRPETERRSHYFHARLSEQFDYVIHIDETRAVEPLERTAGWEAGEDVAETYPSGL